MEVDIPLQGIICVIGFIVLTYRPVKLIIDSTKKP